MHSAQRSSDKMNMQIIEENKKIVWSEVACYWLSCVSRQPISLHAACHGDALHLRAAAVTEAPRVTTELAPFSRSFAHR